MDIEGKTGGQDGFNVGGGFSLLSFNGLVDVPLGDRASFLLTGRKSYKSALYENIFNKYGSQSVNPMPGGGAGPGPTGPSGTVRFAAQFENAPDSYFYELNAKLNFRPSDKDVLSFLSFFNGKDDLDNSRTMEAPSFFIDPGDRFRRLTSPISPIGETWRSVSTGTTNGMTPIFLTYPSAIRIISTTGITVRIYRSIGRRRQEALSGKSQEDNDVKDLTFRFDRNQYSG